MDPVIGLVGAIVITRWSYGLLLDTSKILLDKETEPEVAIQIKSAIEADADNLVADLHVWLVGPHHHSVILTVVTHFPKPPDHYKSLLHEIPGLHHITVEVQKCDGEPCLVRETGPA